MVNVVGVLGTVPTDVLDRLRDAHPDHTVHELPGATVLTRNRSRAWSGPREHGLLWSAQDFRHRVDTWQAAAQHAGASGVAVTPHGPVLHASAWGFDPLYHRIIGGGVVFATAVDPLVHLDDARLDPDWEAWAASLLARFVPDDRTLFRAIRRLPGSWRVQVVPGRRPEVRPALPGMVRSPVEPRDVEDVVGLVDAALLEHPALAERSDDEHRATVPITGGWDSRLLAARAAALFGPRRLRSLSSATHTVGSTPDVVLGARVAAELGLPHTALFPPPSTAIESIVEGYVMTHHETALHAWYVPATRMLAAWGLPVIDGLAGDILIKNGTASELSLTAGSGDPVRDVVHGRFLRPPDPGLPGSEGAALLEELARPAVDAAYRRFEGLREEARLMLMAARTARVIALAPYGLIDTAVEVVTPIAHPEVMAALLAVPWQEKSNHAYARALIEAARPGLSLLPSTNDAVRPVPTGSRRWDEESVLAWEDAVLQRLHERAGMPYAPGRNREMLHPKHLHWRRGLRLLGTWLDRYADRLTSTAAPWW